MKRILIIEDDQDIAEVVEMALEGRYDVKLETNHLNTLAAFRHFNPDLVMIDNQLGQRFASDVIDEIRTSVEYKTIPFVLFSGHEDIERIANEIDAAAYLPKPFALVDLYACVDSVLTQCA